MQLKRLLVIIFLLIGLCFVSQILADQTVVINEVLVHPSSSNKEWVELYVPNGMSVINDWIDDDTDFTSDSASSPKKQITSVVQGSDAQHVVFELSSSIFNNDGDTVALFSSDGQLIDHYQYTKDPGVDIAIGRTPDAIGGFSVLANATRGSANSTSKPTETPTPEPTAKPTKEPKATSTPTTAKNTAVVSKMNDTSTPLIAGDDQTIPTDDLNESDTTDSAQPTSVLGVASKSAEKKPKAKPTPHVLIKGSSTGTLPLVLTSFGGLFLLSCGILIYLKKKGIWN